MKTLKINLLVISLLYYATNIASQTKITFDKISQPKEDWDEGYFEISNKGTLAAITRGRKHPYPHQFYISKDRGSTWIAQSTIAPESHEYVNVEALDTLLLRRRGKVVNEYFKFIYISADNGKTWKKQFDLPDGYSFCEYVDKDTKYCAETAQGYKGYTIFEFQNGKWGKTFDIDIMQTNTVAVGRDQHVVIHEAGPFKPKNFSSLYEYYTAAIGEPIYGKERSSESKLWVSNDMGATWHKVTPPNNEESVKTIYRIYKSNLIFAKTPFPSKIFMSNNGGNEWQQIGLPDGNEINDIIYSPDGTIYATAPDGRIYRSKERL